MDRPNTTGSLQQVMETIDKHPELLALSAFALSCIEYADQRKRPSPPSSPTLSDESLSTQHSIDTTTIISSDHMVSDFERESYYNGITDDGDQPDLLYRMGSATYPWTRPTGRHASLPTKSLRGVYNTPLNKVWRAVLPQIRDLVKEKGPYSSIDPARFVTHHDGEETVGPVVVWIAIPPGSTSADTAHDVSEAILALLVKNGVEGVEVEWREAVPLKLSGPPLLRVVGNQNPIAHARRHLTAALGMPIATAERDIKDAQGSATLFFHENRDKKGRPSTKVFGVSNHHVLRENMYETYEFKGAGAPRQYVRVNGYRRFQRGLEEIKVCISNLSILAELYAREIVKLEEKARCEEVGEDEAAEDAEELKDNRAKLDKAKKDIAELEKFYDEVSRQWSDINVRNIGFVSYSPAVNVDVQGDQYREDWGSFELDEAKFKLTFKGNVVDLGTAFSPDKLTSMFYPQPGSRKTFKYPEGRQLRINGVVTRELLDNPDLYDVEGEPCLVVVKDGSTTNLTVGTYAGLESYLCDDQGVESIELGIYNYDKKKGPAFSDKGDSGALIFDGEGRMLGQLHSGMNKGNSTRCHVTYATPAHFLIGRIKAKYPHADFNRVTW